MGRKNKLMKFAEMRNFPNYYQNFRYEKPELISHTGNVVDFKGNWVKKAFKHENPLVLELACGGGEYTVGLASRYPDKNFIGVDIKGARIYKGASEAMALGLTNAAFVRTRIEQLDLFFETGEASEIWITFPDPFLKERKANRRLTSPFFLDKYHLLLQKGGLLHLKTDETNLFKYSLNVLERDPRFKICYANEDIYAKELTYEVLEIKTHYETLHMALGNTIKYLIAQKN
jgi:tRNA (guanine-N7-)-methyltransferase